MILGLDVNGFLGCRQQLSRSGAAHLEAGDRKGAKLISITTEDLYIKSNYQDFQRYAEVDIAMAADSEATLPSLIEAVKRLATDDRKRVFEERGSKIVDCAQVSFGSRSHRRNLRMECQPHQHTPAFCRSLGTGQERGLGRRHGRLSVGL